MLPWLGRPRRELADERPARSIECNGSDVRHLRIHAATEAIMSGAPIPLLFSQVVNFVHCVGVGGMGVAPLAVYLAQCGFTVSGEDDGLTDEVSGLLSRENVTIGPMPATCDLVVYSSAISQAHPTYLSAVKRGVRLVRRGEMLAEIVRDKKLVAICGSHGKTTTTALLITALRQAKFPAGYILGGLFSDGTPPAQVGSNDWVVAEIDESDGTIEQFSPAVTVTVNLDWDHPDRYRTVDALERTFAALFARTREMVLTSESCLLSQRIVAAAGSAAGSKSVGGGDTSRYATFGPSGDFAGTIESETGEELTLKLAGKFSIARALVHASGEFNAANAAAALAAAQTMGATVSTRLLVDFPGVRRRQAILHVTDDITIIEDYAHHPAEIRALLLSLRKRVPKGGRLLVVFQPHRFSRTAQFKTDFAASLALADRALLLEVYSAGETPLAGGTTADIYAELQRSSPALPVSYLPGEEHKIFAILNREATRGDVIAFVGAGVIDRKARAWLEPWQQSAPKSKRWDEIFDELRQALPMDIRIKREQPLGSKTTMRVGGAARIYAEPKDRPTLKALLLGAKKFGVKIFLLGRGSNVIVPDEGVDGLVISLSHENWAQFEPRPDGRVWAGAGLRLKNLCGLAIKDGLTGFEFLEGIPGSVGGALRMNAGAMGGWMFDIVEQVEVMALSGEIKLLARADMHVNYRHCAELHHTIALGALLRPVAQADASTVSRQIDVYRRKRQESQPREPSAGCIFKNPPNGSAGRLIDECGLKGQRVGDAEVSTVHANFIVNRGKASAADVLELVRIIRARVWEAKGIDLEPEVLLYGKSWKDVL
jgi:UDP-N-acetylmuramate--alanine ligase